MKTFYLMTMGFCLALNLHAQRSEYLLEKGWKFTKGEVSNAEMPAFNDAKWETVDIPHDWAIFGPFDKNNDLQNVAVTQNFETQASLKTGRTGGLPYVGIGWYRTTFHSTPGKQTTLIFDGAMSEARVFVNGKEACFWPCGYNSFYCDVTSLVNEDGKNNTLAVRLENRPQSSRWYPGAGLYRNVHVVTTEKIHVPVWGTQITTPYVKDEYASVCLRTTILNAGKTELTVVTDIMDADGQVVSTKTNKGVINHGQPFTQNFIVERPKLWSPETPVLYKAVSKIYSGDTLLDTYSTRFGIRTIEYIADKGFYLNGEKYPMYGVCRHQDWWGLGSALKNENHDFDLAQIMDVGATTVRFAHYQQSDYLYSRCDSLGLIVWAEIPFVNRVTGYEAENAQSQLRELIRQNFNHPSIYVWGLHNEVYHPHEYTSQLTAALHDLAKTEDPDRYTVSVNGYGHMEHPVNLNADIQGMNRYFGWYEKKIQDIDAWVEGLEEKYPYEKLMLSEYGADANIYHQTEYLGQSLNWTKPYYPETFQTKTHEYQWSVIARHPYIIASYLWNMFDFATPMADRGGIPGRNMKGLMTFDRKTRKDSYFWYKANWSKEPVLHLTQRRNVDREKQETSVTVYSNIGMPKVFLNGRELQGVRKGYTDVHYVFDHVTLCDGKNRLKAVVSRDGKEYTDEIEWNYSGEKNRGTEAYENKNEHFGL